LAVEEPQLPFGLRAFGSRSLSLLLLKETEGRHSRPATTHSVSTSVLRSTAAV